MSGDKERPPIGPSGGDRLVREMHSLAGTRVWISDDVEEYADDMRFTRRMRHIWDDPEMVADREHLRLRRLAFVEWRTKWGKFKLAALIAIAGAIIAWSIPQILQHVMPT
jgi:hypothetical protein